jgi:GT2 family glycosyltransferase/SAM-dependent methyltransferase
MPRGGARERCVRRIYRLLRYVLGSLSRRIRETVLPDEPPAIGSSTAFRPDGVKREPLAGYPFDTVIGEPFSPERIEAVLCHESESLVPARYDVICLSIIDWDFRFQRPQQIMSQFARHGHRVFYVTSSRWFRERDQDPFRVRSVGERLYEVELQSASFWSVYQQVPSAADIDRMLDSLDSLRKTFQIHGAVLYVHAASWTRVAMRARALWDWPVIYECLDDWGHFPHIGSQFKLKEPELVAGSDGVIVTAQRLHDKWAVKSKRTLLARNAADAQFYDAACKPNDILAKAGRPVIGYIGAIADWFDVGLVTRIARRHPDWDFVLVGGIFDTKVDKLRALSNVTFLGQQPYESMPKYLHHFDACIIPFLINDVTRATDPVKFYEYIAAGKPVVSVNLPELALYRDVVYLAETEDQFDSLLAKALTETDPGLAERRKRLARENSWPRRYDAIRAFIDEAMPLVSIVIVSYNNKHLTKLCLESVLAGTKYPRFEVVVVDNASTDGARNMLRGMAERNETIRLIENDANVGFAKANNIGIREARGRFLVLLNNDTVVSNGWLARLVWHLQDPQIGLVGPRTNFVGNEARVDVKYKTWAEMEEAAALLGIASDREVADMRMLAMFCVAMRRDAYERIGPLDEQFEVGMFEDDDYSMRMHRSGYRVVCAMDTFVHHVGQAAFGPLIRSGKYDEIFNLNKKKYEEKWKVAWTPHQLGTLRGSWHADNREEMRKRGRRTAPLPAQSAAPETPAPAVPLEAKTVEYEAGLQKEGLAWGKHMQREAEKELAAWLDHPLVLDHYRRRSLVDGVPWETWIRRHFGGPVSASMELGCGTGTRSLALWSDGISCHIEGLDISAERVAEAEKSRLAVGAPGRFEVGDVNKAELRPSAYDLVFSCHSFHHFLYLESIMECVDKSLKKGGLFVLEEYVGPTQFQWSDKQIRVAQDALSMLPNKLKHCRNGRVKTREGRPTPEQVVAVSPFEAIRSADILPLFERYFDILEIKKLGGTVQHLVYNGIMHNFDPSDVESSKYIANIGDLEDRLIDTGTLTSDFVLVIGRNKQ